ncbi:sugar phosphate isomerase/epimerase family protein [Schumannella soli]|uniref:Sugar phosphate isomerase/epimerase n=1 Tax=Schumannella soli TaxID=2590779 RepID=A0A506XPY8_9MICO|nr:TIM barrel protein [Schumannella soli]TPW74764.1 sugar phosphate isomerase/epimerase [Schumannella soli]
MSADAAAERSPLGVHSGLWGAGWSPEQAERAIGGAAAAGFDLIELPVSGPDTVDFTRAALERHGLRPTVSLALRADEDVNSEDAAAAARGEARLAAAVDHAAALGADFLGGVIYSQMGRYLSLPTAAGRRSSLAALRRTARRAADVGVTLGVEYVNRYESNLLNTAAQTLEYLDELGEPNAVVHLDTFHAAIEEIDVADAAAVAGGRLGYIHASESHRGELGTGRLDWDALLRRLVGQGFAGPITVESFSSAIMPAADQIDIGLWRPMWSDADRVARRSHDFLRSRLDGLIAEREGSAPSAAA